MSDSTLLYEIEHGIGTKHFMLYKRENHKFQTHMHRCFEIVLVLEGELNMRIENEYYPVRKNDLVLIKPNIIHNYTTLEGKHSSCIICVFSADMIAAISVALTKYKVPEFIYHWTPELYKNLFLNMDKARDLATEKGFLYTICGLFYQQLDFVTEDTQIRDNDLIRDVFIYMENNLSGSCELINCANELGYNQSYISRRFKSIVGMPYYAYVQKVKIDHACYLLQNTQDSIMSVASQCGYMTISSFNRTFKLQTGVSPGEYRKKTERINSGPDELSEKERVDDRL